MTPSCSSDVKTNFHFFLQRLHYSSNQVTLMKKLMNKMFITRSTSRLQQILITSTLSWQRSLSFRSQSIDLKGPAARNGLSIFPAIIYLFKINNRNIRKRCQICSKLTIKTLERCQRCIVDFEQINVGWLVFNPFMHKVIKWPDIL